MREHPQDRTDEQTRIDENLVRIAVAIGSELDLDRVVQTVTDEATALCRAQFGAFFYNVTNESGESYVLYTLCGAPRSAFERFPMPRNTAVFEPTFTGTGVVRSDDITKDPRYGRSAPYHGMPAGHLPVRSYLAIPVKSRSGEIFGGLFFGHSDVGVFAATDEQRLIGVAAQAAVAIENARLYQAARRSQIGAAHEREKLRLLFKQAPALIVILRGPEHVYEFVNDAAWPIVGRNDALGKPVREILPFMPQERMALLDRVFATGERWRGDAVPSLRDWNGDGRPFERFFNMVWEPYRDAQGRVQGVMSFGFEVTDQVLATRRLEEAKSELQIANRMKDAFLATVSHELRTPLNAILGWVRLLRSESLSEEKRESGLETIERNARAQAQLIEDLLDVSRIISGKLRLDVRELDLAKVIENALESVRPAAEAKQVSLQALLDHSQASVTGDADRLQQVVWNLLTNAVKFTPRGGNVRVLLQRGETDIDVAVVDDGEGIDPEFLPKVFERFRQADATVSRKHGGLGLGLAIARHLVELHGGTVAVDSAGPGRGSTFTVTLPLSGTRSTPSDRLPVVTGGKETRKLEYPPELADLHFLVVDDEPDARELVAEILKACRARVSTAANAAEALQRILDACPDILISDIAMPDGDGYSLIASVRALDPSQGGKMPAVALTAYARIEDRARALASGFDLHLTKPVEPSDLLDALTSAVSRIPSRGA